MAKRLIRQHGLRVRFGFDQAKNRVGACHYEDGVPVLITVSAHYADKYGPGPLRDTVLHEIAHALTPGHGHDSVWRAKALEIGCRGERYANDALTLAEKQPWSATCMDCGAKFGRWRTPQNLQSCGHCSKGFSHTKVLWWHKDGEPFPIRQMPQSYINQFVQVFGGLDELQAR